MVFSQPKKSTPPNSHYLKGLPMALTATKVKNAVIKEKPYKLSDEKGMYLLVSPNGSKRWRLKYRHIGKEKTLAFGVYPDISLAQARELRDEARKLLANDADPGEAKKAHTEPNKLPGKYSAMRWQPAGPNATQVPT